MLALYLAAFGFGAVLIGVSLFFGGADKDFDKDVGADLDKDFDKSFDKSFDKDFDKDVELGPDDVESESGLSALGDLIWVPLLSMRFWTFGSGAFGFAGAVLTLGGLSQWIVFPLAVLLGLVTGTAAAFFFRALKKDTVSGDTSLNRMIGEEARTLLPISAGSRGTIAWVGPTGRVELVATTRDPEPIPVGSTVIIAGIEDGVADVSVLPPGDGVASQRRRLAANPPQST